MITPPPRRRTAQGDGTRGEDQQWVTRCPRPRDRPQSQGPLLVVTGPARPEDDLRTVGGTRARSVHAQARTDLTNRPVGVDVPLLVRPTAVPDHDRGPIRGVLRLEALGSVVDGKLAAGVRPPLVVLTVAVPQLRLGAVGRCTVVDVHAPVGLPAHD